MISTSFSTWTHPEAAIFDYFLKQVGGESGNEPPLWSCDIQSQLSKWRFSAKISRLSKALGEILLWKRYRSSPTSCFSRHSPMLLCIFRSFVLFQIAGKFIIWCIAIFIANCWPNMKTTFPEWLFRCSSHRRNTSKWQTSRILRSFIIWWFSRQPNHLCAFATNLQP